MGFCESVRAGRLRGDIVGILPSALRALFLFVRAFSRLLLERAAVAQTAVVMTTMTLGVRQGVRVGERTEEAPLRITAHLRLRRPWQCAESSSHPPVMQLPLPPPQPAWLRF